MPDHLSRLEDPALEATRDELINENFPTESLEMVEYREEPWYADYANYLTSRIVVKGWSHHQRKKFFADVKHYFWEDPYLWRMAGGLVTDGRWWSMRCSESQVFTCSLYENCPLATTS